MDRDKVLKQGVDLHSVYQTLQAFMGGLFVNYFNRFGRVWQVYVQAEGEFRTQAENVGLFRVRNGDGADSAALDAGHDEDDFRAGIYHPLQRLQGGADQRHPGARVQFSARRRQALEEVFAQTMPPEMGYDYSGMSFQEKAAAQGVPASAIFGLSLLFVFLILAAQYESWSLPFSVLLTTPIAVFGAFLALWLRAFENNVYAQIGLVMLIGLVGQERNPDRRVRQGRVRGGQVDYRCGARGCAPAAPSDLDDGVCVHLGVLPLAIASGAGAVGRQIMGTAVIGGMLAASLIAIFLIPVSFYVVERVSHRREAEQPPAQQPFRRQSRNRHVPASLRSTRSIEASSKGRSHHSFHEATKDTKFG